MSYFINKIDQVKKMFFNEEKREPEKSVKKTPNTIEIKSDYHLDKNDSIKDIYHDTIISRKITYTGIDDDDNNKDDNDEEDYIYDDSPYIFNNVYSQKSYEYHYINDRLNRTFGSCMDYNSTKYQIHLCVFTINSSCHFKDDTMPFLQFVFENKPGIFKFPSIDYNCPNKESTETIDEDVYFKNECIKKLLDIFEIDKIDEIMMEKIYKGFLEFDEKNIFVVFDFTYIPSLVFKTEEKRSFLFFSNKVEKYEWGIIDEIRKKEIQKIPIENIVLNFFQKYRYMNEIKTNDRKLLQIPSSLYLCKYENGSYKNITETLNTNYEKRSVHPYLGFFYFFSIEQFQKNAKRYAVFSENNVIVDKPFDKMKEEDHYDITILKHSVFEYVENNQSIWCVKPDSLFYEL
jgi:hypothetical protein